MDTTRSERWRWWGMGALWALLPVGAAVVALAWAAPPVGAEANQLRPVVKWHPSHRAGDAVSKAVFAGGCYWSLEHAYRNVEGVVSTRVGLSGGAEAVEVAYDPARVTYGALLEVFMANHDPRAEAPAGVRGDWLHRSAVFVATPEQTAEAGAYLSRLTAENEGKPILTTIQSLAVFEEAAEREQQYFEKRGRPSLFAGGAGPGPGAAR